MKNKYQNFLICSVLLFAAYRQVSSAHEHELNKIMRSNQITPKKNISFTDEVERIYFNRSQTEFTYPTEWCKQSDYDQNILDADFESDQTEYEKDARDQNVKKHRKKILENQKYDPLALERFRLEKLHDLLVLDNSELKESNDQLKQQNLSFKKICQSILLFSGINFIAVTTYFNLNHTQNND